MPNKVIIPGIQKLFDLGHGRNPAMPTGLTQDDLPGLQWHDSGAKTMLQSWQDLMKPVIDEIAIAIHKRPIEVDGDIGPATLESFDVPRCGHPDYEAVGYEEANWPTACRGRLKWGRSFDALPGLSKADTDKVFWSMANNWTQALEDVTIEIAAPRDRAGCHIYADIKSLGGSTLAWSYLANNNCSTTLAQAYDNRNWTISLGSPVGTHETGHALGCSHVRDSAALMFPSIHSQSIARRGYPNATDLSAMRALGYRLSGKPQIAGDALFRPRGQEPDPPVDPTGTYFTGEFVRRNAAGEPLEEWILIPKPKV